MRRVKDVPGYRHIHACNDGKIYGKRGHELKVQMQSGRPYVLLWNNGVIKRQVAKLVAHAFHGKYRKVEHVNGNKLDCRPENLRYVEGRR